MSKNQSWFIAWGGLIWLVSVAVVALSFINVRALADDWPQWRGSKRDGEWRETGIVEKFPSAQLSIKWRAPVSSGYSGPTVANGRVYVTDRVAEPEQIERVHCFDASNGAPVWSHAYEARYGKNVGYTAGPRAAVTIDNGKAYSVGTMGHLHCFDAAKGDVLWNKDLDAIYSIRMPLWGVACSPLVEQDLLIVVAAGDKACLVAFDKNTGEERWTALDDNAQYSSPIVIEQAGKRVLVCWTGDAVVGLDPRTGTEYWRSAMKPVQMPIGIATPVMDGTRLFVSSFYDGSLMLRLVGAGGKPAVEEVWRRRGESELKTDSLHCMIGTPTLEGDHVYGVDSYGELRCLDANTGDRIWESLKAIPKNRWSTIHMVKNGDRHFLFNERGELIIARLSPSGYQEFSRAKLLEPTTDQLERRGEGVCWAHPAYANKHVFARSDKELVCASLAE